ncbi:unnamed protein product [Polarella glacialis]|uniref:Uncharacterized protein n=1 Tax=Polarella glacialis TaxID=89957 RepID=A0A813K7C4_POLGL|nr:unnamed protein product [Polarella glacialis]
MKLTTRQQELYKKGSGLRSLDHRFRRTVMSLDKRAKSGGYPGGYEDRYRMDYAYRKERLNQGLNFDSLREALLIEAGPRFDPNWRGGTGKSAAAYGNAVNPDHQAEYRVGQHDAWAVQRKKGAKGKGKRSVKIDNYEQKAWYDRLDLSPAERPEGENPHGQVANSASQWINDESQWTDYPDNSRRKSARLSWYDNTETPSSGSNATRWEQGQYRHDYDSNATASRRAREPLSENLEQQFQAIDWNQHFSGEAAPRGELVTQTFTRDVRYHFAEAEVKDEDDQPDWS